MKTVQNVLTGLVLALLCMLVIWAIAAVLSGIAWTLGL